jgi:hypothetical protein
LAVYISYKIIADMKPEDKSPGSLREKLDNLKETGIQADRQHLKRNMCTQFSDPYEFIREYVVNAYDASATFCLVKVSEDETSLKVLIHDNGNGMGFNRLRDFLTIFRSRKDNPIIKSVGRHGIGKLSVAALPGLTHFRAVTSTGTECHEFETDSLLDDHPIAINRNGCVPPQGTLFEITFKKDRSALKLAQKLSDILYTYVRFLPISIRFYVDNEIWQNEASGRHSISREWAYPPECLGRSYNIKLRGKSCEIVIGTGTGAHEIYQNRVFISSNYNLFSYGRNENIWIPNLMIRVDSEAFDLPFGRHCLCNEEILSDLAKEIRERIMPSYFDFITSHLDFRTGSEVSRISEKADAMTIGLLKYRQAGYTWALYPVFRNVEGVRFSMSELDIEVRKSEKLYIEAENSEGIDFSHFKAPVLSVEQPAGAINLIKDIYSQFIINLKDEDTVLEMPANDKLKLSKEQKHFERFLVFKHRNLDLEQLGGFRERKGNSNSDSGRPGIRFNDYAGICEEARIAKDDLLNMVWRVNYLVERDGETPCMRKKYMHRNNTITLNLFHAEIREFVQMSALNPGLAAHWAIAMCLADKKILPHISEEAREDLLIIDAISKVGNDRVPDPLKDESGEIDRDFMDFVRNCINRPSDNF